jgi:hypothetical protein
LQIPGELLKAAFDAGLVVRTHHGVVLLGWPIGCSSNV